MQHDLLMRRKQTWSQQTERWHASPHLSDGLRVTGCTTLAADISIWTPSFYDWGYCNFMQVCKLLFWKSILALKSSASSSDLTFLLKQMVWSLVPISTRAEASVDGHDQYSWQHLFSFGREDHGGSRRDEILSHHWVMWLSNHLLLQNPSRPCIWTQIQGLRMTSVLQCFIGSGPCFHTSFFHGCLEPGAQKTAVKRSLWCHLVVDYIN